jgi:hypothetical protein
VDFIFSCQKTTKSPVCVRNLLFLKIGQYGSRKFSILMLISDMKRHFFHVYWQKTLIPKNVFEKIPIPQKSRLHFYIALFLKFPFRSVISAKRSTFSTYTDQFRDTKFVPYTSDFLPFFDTKVWNHPKSIENIIILIC